MSAPTGIAGILLAAGAATRFGGAKLLAPLPAESHGIAAGTPLALAALRHLQAALTRIVAVVRPGGAPLRDALAAAGAELVECAQAHEGMGVSLAAGVAAARDAPGWLIALADMPWIAPATIARLAQALDAGASIVAPTFQGRRGHPVGFAAVHRDALLALGGDEGARHVVGAHAARVVEIAVDDDGVLRDVDRRADLRP